MSRSINSLMRQGFASKRGERWVLTAKGTQEAQALRQQMPEQALRTANTTLRSLVHQAKLASVANSASLENLVADGRRTLPLDSLSQAMKALAEPPAMRDAMFNLTRSTASASAFEPSLSRTGEAIDSLTRSIANTAALQPLISKTRDAMNSLTQSITNTSALEPSFIKARDAMNSLSLSTVNTSALDSSVLKTSVAMDSITRQVGDAFKTIGRTSGSVLANLTSSYSAQDWYIPHQRLMESLALESIRPIANALSSDSLASSFKSLTAPSKIFQQSIATFLDVQEDYIHTMRTAIGPTASQISSVNFGIGKIVADLSSISELRQMSRPLERIIPGIETIAESYKVYAREGLEHFEQASSTLARAAVWDVAIPTWTTGNFISTVKRAAIGKEKHTRRTEKTLRVGIGLNDLEAQIVSVLRSVHPRFVDMWVGAWEVLESNSSDSVRQSAHSARELWMQLLAHLAPDSAFTADEIRKDGHLGRPTRRMRVRKIIKSRSATDLVESTTLAANAMYAWLASVSHDRTDRLGGEGLELKGVLMTLGGLVLFVISSKE